MADVDPRQRYEDQKRILREKVDGGVEGSTQERLAFARDGFYSATVEYMIDGLNKYLAAAAEDRKWAERHRIAILLLTLVIAAATAIQGYAVFTQKPPQQPHVTVTNVNIMPPIPLVLPQPPFIQGR